LGASFLIHHLQTTKMFILQFFFFKFFIFLAEIQVKFSAIFVIFKNQRLFKIKEKIKITKKTQKRTKKNFLNFLVFFISIFLFQELIFISFSDIYFFLSIILSISASFSFKYCLNSSFLK
jgi:hypothetical protein